MAKFSAVISCQIFGEDNEILSILIEVTISNNSGVE